VVGDLTEPATFETACRGCSLTIFAAGARRLAYATDPQAITDFQTGNVMALRNLGIAVVRAGNRPLIHIGSLFALGIRRSGALSEDTQALPTTPFEISEWQGEQELRMLNATDGLDCRIMRLPPVTGATSRGGLLDALRAASCDPTWAIEIAENGNARKPLISPRDFLAAVERTWQFGRSGRCYHFASGNYPLRKIAATLRDSAVGVYSVGEFMEVFTKRSQDLLAFLANYIKLDVVVATQRAHSELNWTGMEEDLSFGMHETPPVESLIANR
jgi:nucleoside-diphosphate-sugar epimerase